MVLGLDHQVNSSSPRLRNHSVQAILIKAPLTLLQGGHELTIQGLKVNTLSIWVQASLLQGRLILQDEEATSSLALSVVQFLCVLFNLVWGWMASDFPIPSFLNEEIEHFCTSMSSCGDTLTPLNFLQEAGMLKVKFWGLACLIFFSSFPSSQSVTFNPFPYFTLNFSQYNYDFFPVYQVLFLPPPISRFSSFTWGSAYHLIYTSLHHDCTPISSWS